MNNHITNWGPAKHDPTHPLHQPTMTSVDDADSPLQVSFDRRDHRAGIDLRGDESLVPEDN